MLEELRAIVTGERISWEDLTDSDSDGSTSDIEGEDQPTTELAQLLSNIAEINTCLMRLSMSIRNPAPHDQFEESKHISFSHYETFDVEHAREKFPHAAQYLVVRLGKAISRRRQFLRYREEHRRKYEQGLPSQPRIQAASFQANQEVPSQHHRLGTVGTTSEELQSTVASSIPRAVKTINSVAELMNTMTSRKPCRRNPTLHHLEMRPSSGHRRCRKQVTMVSPSNALYASA